GEMPGEMKLGVIRKRVALPQRRRPQPAQSADVEPEPVALRPVVLKNRFRHRPGPIKQRYQAVDEHVEKPYEGRVSRVADAVAREFGQMHRERAVGPEKAQEVRGQPPGAAVSPRRK